jgi:hypothetical protein
MSQLVETKRQAKFKNFKRFGAFKGLVEQKNVVFNSFVCKLGLFWRSFHSRFKLAHSRQKRLTLHTNSLNKLLLLLHSKNVSVCFFSEQKCTFGEHPGCSPPSRFLEGSCPLRLLSLEKDLALCRTRCAPSSVTLVPVPNKARSKIRPTNDIDLVIEISKYTTT